MSTTDLQRLEKVLDLVCAQRQPSSPLGPDPSAASASSSDPYAPYAKPIVRSCSKDNAGTCYHQNGIWCSKVPAALAHCTAYPSASTACVTENQDGPAGCFSNRAYLGQGDAYA